MPTTHVAVVRVGGQAGGHAHQIDGLAERGQRVCGAAGDEAMA
ncbi:hypothetical protein [Xanthomonas theicola]|nr:hypothetical protein [Xanthomonas theicola]